MDELSPDESALLRNLAGFDLAGFDLAGFDLAGEAPRRGLDPAGEVLNERARPQAARRMTAPPG